MYGARKVWRQLGREWIVVARCTVERLMRELGLQGVRRGKTRRTTTPDAAAARPADLVERNFSVSRPTSCGWPISPIVATWSGLVYVALVIDAFSRYLVGWQASRSLRTDLALDALAETIIGLYKTELIRRRGPWDGLDDVEYATLEWVDWFNHRRLLEPIGHLPPAEFEAVCDRKEAPTHTAGLKQSSLR